MPRKVTPDPAGEKPAGNVLLAAVYIVKMIKAPNVAGGGITVEVGFQLEDLRRAKLSQAELVQFAVFQDVDFKTPSLYARLGGTPTAGTIVDGADTPALLVKTDATGLFKCTLTDLVDETVHLACNSAFGGPALSCKAPDGVHSIAFS